MLDLVLVLGRQRYQVQGGRQHLVLDSELGWVLPLVSQRLQHLVFQLHLLQHLVFQLHLLPHLVFQLLLGALQLANAHATTAQEHARSQCAG